MRRMLIIETLIAIFVNAIVFPVGLRTAGLVPPPTMTGPHGALIDGVLATVCPIVLMTIVMSLVLRARFRRRPVSPWTATSFPIAAVPRQIVARAIFLAGAGLLVLLPLRLLAIRLLGLLPMTGTSHFMLNGVYGCAIGAIFMPVILLATAAEADVRTGAMSSRP